MKISAFTKTYNGRTVVNVPDIELENGKIYAVIGANGSGKSTLAKVLADIEKPDGGKNVLSNTVVSSDAVCSDSKAAPGGSGVGYLPQKSFAFRMSTKSNIMLGGSDSDKAEQLMDALAISHLASKNAKRLSGGETARMALARLLMSPFGQFGQFGLLVLDEPSAAMDMEATLKAEELIKEYRDECGCTVLIITQSVQQARRLADEVLFFSDGELKERIDSEQLLTSPKTKELKRFLDFY